MIEPILQACFLLWTYALAAVPFGLWLTTLFGGEVDLRHAGSGNIGATNVARVFGWHLALPVLILDLAKGTLPTWAALVLWPDASAVWPALVAITAFVGHCWPVYLEFRGGKGVATGAGALLALTPRPTLIAIGIWVIALTAIGRSSVAALVAALSMVLLTLALDPAQLPVVLLLALGVAMTHMANIRRLVAGREQQVVRAAVWTRTPRPTARDVLQQGPSGIGAGAPLWPTQPPRPDDAEPDPNP